jgi:hypothetical protein
MYKVSYKKMRNRTPEEEKEPKEKNLIFYCMYVHKCHTKKDADRTPER